MFNAISKLSTFGKSRSPERVLHSPYIGECEVWLFDGKQGSLNSAVSFLHRPRVNAEVSPLLLSHASVQRRPESEGRRVHVLTRQLTTHLTLYYTVH